MLSTLKVFCAILFAWATLIAAYPVPIQVSVNDPCSPSVHGVLIKSDCVADRSTSHPSFLNSPLEYFASPQPRTRSFKPWNDMVPRAPSIHFRQDDDETKNELRQRLTETLNNLTEKVQDAIEKGKVPRGDLMKRLKEIKERLEQLEVAQDGESTEWLKQASKEAMAYRVMLDNIIPS
ncbi:hypothetical protein RhiJN_20831 [Ceratobasidium sp. AG-Ba]|nr:hypothetical protein RhiJN_20831 [Ceratobasidium sp. AG-Ba]